MFLGISRRISLIALGLLFASIAASAMNRQEENANNVRNPSVNNRLWLVCGSPIIISNNTGNITINSGANFGFSLPSWLRSCLPWHTFRQERQIPVDEALRKVKVVNNNGHIIFGTHNFSHRNIVLARESRSYNSQDVDHVRNEDGITINSNNAGLIRLLVPENYPYAHRVVYDLNTNNGNITAHDIQNQMVATANNGNVTLRNIGNNATAYANNGNVTFSASALNAQALLKTINGKVYSDFALNNANAQRQLNLSTNNGYVWLRNNSWSHRLKNLGWWFLGYR